MRLHFGDFCFDTDRRELSQNGAAIHLTPKAVDLLRFLINERPTWDRGRRRCELVDDRLILLRVVLGEVAGQSLDAVAKGLPVIRLLFLQPQTLLFSARRASSAT